MAVDGLLLTALSMVGPSQKLIYRYQPFARTAPSIQYIIPRPFLVLFILSGPLLHVHKHKHTTDERISQESLSPFSHLQFQTILQ